MRILHVITGLQKAAGTTTFVENVVREQCALGHTVEVITNDSCSGKSKKGGLNSALQLQLDTTTKTIIHIHGLWSPLLHKAARFARKNKIPVVWSTHGMTAPWALHHKWWKKCLPWCLYQLPDLRSAALIHCTTDLEADWNRTLGFSNVFVAPLGTNLPTGRGSSPLLPAIDSRTKDALTRDCAQGKPCGGGERADSAVGRPPCDRRAMAEKKVAEWLEGVDAATFEAALRNLVEEKTAAGEYRFSRAEDRELAMQGARRFFADFARSIVPLSDGRCVYFAPDPRASECNACNAMSWAEYAFHAVSTGGAKVPGTNYNERWFDPHKVRALGYLEEVLRAERCFVRLSKVDCRYDSVMFAGELHDGEAVQVGTRIDEMGNMDANLSEVTFNAARRRQKKLPRLVPLTEAIQAVVHHQNTAGSYPTDDNSVANPSSSRKGDNSEREGVSTEGLGVSTKDPLTHNFCTLTPKTLLYVGRIYPVKALDNAIRAYAKMTPELQSKLRIRLVGPDQAGHMAELINLCQQLDLSYSTPSTPLHGSQIEFVGPKYDKDLDDEYWTCDALILVSHTENFGATVIDALAHAKPVITSTKTPWSIVRGKVANSTFQLKTPTDTRCGWWIDNDPETLARTFDAFASSSASDLNLMGQNGLALVKQSYTWPAVANNLIGQYMKLVEGDS